jgi:hypothetical protein
MTPETVRTIAQIRQEFYALFTETMDTPVTVVNRNSYSSNFSIAFWFDGHQRLNYLCIFAYTAPDQLIPDRPLTLRLVMNTGGDALVITRYKKGNQELNRNWRFQLILLPEEVLSLLPWIVNLIRFYDADSVASLPQSPAEFDFNSPIKPLSSGPITTYQANYQLQQSCKQKVSSLQPALPKKYMS